MSGFADCIDDLGKLHRQDRQLRLGSQEIEGRFGRMTIPLSPRPRERQSITGSQQALRSLSENQVRFLSSGRILVAPYITPNSE